MQDSEKTNTKKWTGTEYERLKAHQMAGTVCFVCHKSAYEIVNGKYGETCSHKFAFKTGEKL